MLLFDCYFFQTIIAAITYCIHSECLLFLEDDCFRVYIVCYPHFALLLSGLLYSLQLHCFGLNASEIDNSCAVESAIGEGKAVIKKRDSWKRQNERRRIFLRIVFNRICLSGNVIQLCIISSLARYHKTE